MKIIAGLGNPETGYGNTRHNVGFMAVGLLRKEHAPAEVIKARHYRGWGIKIAGVDTVLIKPKTFMNESGIAVKKAFERFGGRFEDCIIVHDDLDIPVGRIKITSGKGPGGHNGVISVINELGSRDFIRVRIGIGRTKTENSYVDYVLSPFLPEEEPLIKDSLEKACLAIEEIIKSGIEKAMSLYNA
ncbi:MAG: aminoacyl-tRNA hydrolase [Candidatus Omnitrophica bacterium]|nr:aminoacyl-tRNA hydrolase [Candidatus Omnitrophota bacterium]